MDKEKEGIQPFDCAALDNTSNRKSLTTLSTHDYLQYITRTRFDNSKGMMRKEMVGFIAEIKIVPMMTARNCYNHVILLKALSQLKRCVVLSQHS